MRVRIMLAFAILASATLVAQTFRGTILGTVTDASGAVVSGAKVAAKNTATGLERTTADQRGRQLLDPRTAYWHLYGYHLPERLPDLRHDRRRGRRRHRAPCRCQFKLEGFQTVEVSGDFCPRWKPPPPSLAALSRADDDRESSRQWPRLHQADLPESRCCWLARPDFRLARLIRHVLDERLAWPSNNFLLDGTDMNDGFRNDPAINEAGVFGDPATILPLDAVAELRVLSNYEAEYGRNSGAVVNIVTKSGTNQLHGSGLEYQPHQFARRRSNFFNNVGGRRIRSTTISSADRWAARS